MERVMEDLDARAIELIRGFAMDAPRQANSGHPGTAMALAPLAHVLFSRIMRHDPADPHWPDRDRFVLSCGHASILLYSMLYLSGYGLELDDLRAFRQWGSRTPGHPEARHTTGVEVTTGPLGQGFGNSVGHGGGRALPAGPVRRRRDGPPHVRAGQRRRPPGGPEPRGRLPRRPPRPRPAHRDLRRQPHHDRRRHRPRGQRRLRQALRRLRLAHRVPRRDRQRPRRPRGRRPPGHGRRGPAVDARAAQPHRLPVARVHRQPEGPRRPVPARGDRAAPRSILGLPPDETFYAPADVVDAYREPHRRPRRRGPRRPGSSASTPGPATGPSGTPAGPGGPSTGWEAKLPTFEPGEKLATRDAIGKAINATLEFLPGLHLGRRRPHRQHRHQARRRRQPVARAPRGPPAPLRHPRARHGLGHERHGHARRRPAGRRHVLRVLATTCGPTLRLASLSRAKDVFVFTHDSVGLGEDGPTHQPIEHLAAIRAIPGLQVIRPADANETAAAWRVAVAPRRTDRTRPHAPGHPRGHRRQRRGDRARASCATSTTRPWC